VEETGMVRRHIHEAAIMSRTPEQTLDVYRLWADDYEQELLQEMGYRAPATVAGLFARHVSDTDAAILDAGCGTGIMGALLAGEGFRSIDGLDFSPDMLSRARAKEVYRALLQADLNRELALADDSYDAVVCVGTFTPGHVGPSALRELLRVCRSGAILCFTVRSEYWDEAGFADVVRRLEDKGLWSIVEEQTIDYVAEDESTCQLLVCRVS